MTQPDEWKSPYDPPRQPAGQGAQPGPTSDQPAQDQPAPDQPVPPSPYGQPYPQEGAPPPYQPPYQQPYAPGYAPGPDQAQADPQQPYGAQPYPGQPYPPQQYQYGMTYPTAPEKNALGVWSLVLGILSIIMLFSCAVGFLAGIPAVITGHLSRKAEKEGLANNGGMGLAGIITGWITIGLTLLAIVGFAILFSIPEFREGFFGETTSSYSYE